MTALSSRPSEGVKRLAVLFGLIGAGVGYHRFGIETWQDASKPFWRHAYYEAMARVNSAKAEKDEDGNPILVVVRSSALSAPAGFSEAYDQEPWEVASHSENAKANWGTPTYEDIPPPQGYPVERPTKLAESSAISPNEFMASGKRFLLTREDLSWVPAPVRLKAHPSGTVVYFKRFEKGAAAEPGLLAWLAYCRVALPLIGGVVLAGATVLLSGWVVDGFREPRRR